MMVTTRGLTPRTIRRAAAAGAVNLEQRRRWFDDTPPDAGADDSPPASGQADDVASLPQWAQEIIRQARSDAAERRVALKKQQEEQATRDAARLAEEGKWKELAEARAKELDALKPVSDRAAALEAKIQATNEARIKRIPENYRTAIPTQYTPEQLSEWLDANEQLFTRPTAPNLDGGAGSGGGAATAALTPELRAIAAKLGLKPEEMAAEMKRREQTQQE